MYKLQYIRLGFANNSSSTHSIVILNKSTSDNFEDGDDYGWQKFLLVSKEEKAKYFASQTNYVFGPSIGNASNVISGNYFGTEAGSKIDHQSIFALPELRNGEKAFDFFKDIGCRIINDNRIGIYGGNDNSDEDLTYKELNIPFRHLYDGWLARKEKDETWILFNVITGTKIRLAVDLLKNTTNRKSDTPELVDVKITDNCISNCTFCYQNSSPNGKHANLNDIENIAIALDKLNVFEVVLGGGEPTNHPDFIKIIKLFRKYNIVPSFTTRNISWFNDLKFCKKIRDNIGSVALSCTSLEDLKRYESALENLGKSEVYLKTTYQFIVGLPGLNIKEILLYMINNKIYRNISLVGYKQTGRAVLPGEEINVEELSNLMRFNWSYINVDTAFLKSYPSFVQQKTCETKEGLNSIYIDAVTKTVRESSYTGVPWIVDFDKEDLAKRINDIFEKI